MVPVVALNFDRVNCVVTAPDHSWIVRVPRDARPSHRLGGAIPAIDILLKE